MEEKKNEMPASAGNESASPLLPEDQLSALIRQLSRTLEESARADTERRNILEQRENALKKQEMAAQIREALQKHGLPVQLASGLAFESMEEMDAAVCALEENFRTAVQQGVEERLLSDAPKAQPLQPLAEMTDEDYYAAVYSRV